MSSGVGRAMGVGSVGGVGRDWLLGAGETTTMDEVEGTSSVSGSGSLKCGIDGAFEKLD